MFRVVEVSVNDGGVIGTLNLNNDIFQAIQHLQNIASTRRKNRLKNGAINFNKQEVRFALDEKNNPKSR